MGMVQILLSVHELERPLKIFCYHAMAYTCFRRSVGFHGANLYLTLIGIHLAFDVFSTRFENGAYLLCKIRVGDSEQGIPSLFQALGSWGSWGRGKNEGGLTAQSLEQARHSSLALAVNCNASDSSSV